MSAGSKTIYIIGGTTEANIAAARLEADGLRAVVSVASPLGAAMSRAGSVDAGPKDGPAMAAAAAAADAAAILDCSHPYAAAATGEARKAAALAEIPYLRFTRPPGAPAAGADRVDSWEDAVRYLSRGGERAMLTIGTRNLRYFTAPAGDDAAIPDFAVRILPVPESLSACHKLGIKPADIIAACPPHSVDFNRACLRRTGARVLVTKDTGAAGGLPEKLEAAALEDVRVLIVARPAEPAGTFHDLDAAAARLKELLGS